MNPAQFETINAAVANPAPELFYLNSPDYAMQLDLYGIRTVRVFEESYQRIALPDHRNELEGLGGSLPNPPQAAVCEG